MRNFTSAEILYSIISRPDKGGRSAVDLFNFRSEETTKTDPEGFAALCGKLEKLVANGYLTKYGKRYQVNGENYEKILLVLGDALGLD